MHCPCDICLPNKQSTGDALGIQLAIITEETGQSATVAETADSFKIVHEYGPDPTEY